MQQLAQQATATTWQVSAAEAGRAALTRFIELGSDVAVAAAIMLAGWLLARFVGAMVERAVRGIGVDRVTQHLGVTEAMARADVRSSISGIVGAVAYWSILLTTVLWAIEVIGLAATSVLIERWVAFVPNLVGSVFIVFVGILLARPAASMARSAAVAADLGSAMRIGLVVQWTVVAIAFTIALQQLGVAVEILIAPLTAVVAALALSAGLTFALGARPLVTHILAGHFLRRSLPRDSELTIDGEAGLVEHIGSTETRLRGRSGSRSIPNARLIEAVVTWS